MVIPHNNSHFYSSSSLKQLASYARINEDQGGSTVWMTTMSRVAGSGFYSDLIGPLPFIIAPVSRDKYTVLTFFRPILFWVYYGNGH